MIVTETRGRWEAQSSYAERHIPKSAGFRWDPVAKVWWTDDEEKARLIASDNAVAAINGAAEEKAEADNASIESSRATDADIVVPAPDGLEYLPFQRAGIAYAASRPSTLVGDEMGLGKTIQALGVINSDDTIVNTLVICPKAVTLNWGREAEKWLVRPTRIEVVAGTKADFPVHQGVTILNYDILHAHRASIDAVAWDLLIVDEAHYLKNKKARRTKCVLGAKAKRDGKWVDSPAPIAAKRRIFLTGTPIVNRPVELWPIVQSIDPSGLGKNFMKFAKRYCNARQGSWGWDFTGSSNLDELQRRVRSSVLVRRLKKDVLTELPAKRRQVIAVPANGATGAVRAETDAWDRYEDEITELRAAVALSEASEDKAAYDEAVRQLKDRTQAAFSEIAKLRHETALAKVPAVIDHITETLEAVDKVVVFAHHRDVISAIRDAFHEECVVITGATSAQDRQDCVDAFQTSPACRVFIGNVQAAGVGITLTAAAHVIFAELDWVPGNLSQAEDRCHRIGQHDSVLVQHLVIDGSLDARIAHAVVAMQAVIDRALDEDPGKIEALQIPVIPGEAKAIVDRSGKPIELSDEQVTAIHAALGELAARCDGARELDGAGFNALDTTIGRSLATSPRLSLKQADLGRRIVLKYHRQLGDDVIASVKGE